MQLPTVQVHDGDGGPFGGGHVGHDTEVDEACRFADQDGAGVPRSWPGERRKVVEGDRAFVSGRTEGRPGLQGHLLQAGDVPHQGSQQAGLIAQGEPVDVPVDHRERVPA